jgi:Cytochrome c/Cytochrome c7 and related cytochrome c
MKFHQQLTKTLLTSILFVLFSFISNNILAEDGKALFMKNCASCHIMGQKSTGPNLVGALDRWNNKRANLHAWIKNSGAYLKTGDKYANDLFSEYKSSMTAFDGTLDDKQIDVILDYVRDWKPPVAVAGDTSGGGKESDNSLLFGVLTLILAVVAFTLMQVNSNLKKLADDKVGIAAAEPVPVWKNRTYIAFGIVLLVIIGGYLTAKGAIGFGRNKGYVPEQPIFYSHKVHAGINQINCQYCHGGVNDSKHANIPSVNVCMNCHLTINEYKGTAKLINEEGEEVNGTAEIKKLYKYANYTAGQKEPWDATKATQIPWTKIHNLPDHVYFNHSQHVVAGKQQCQTCHGEVTKMDEIKQFTDLSMGWCINCHRETKVQFKENGFYSIYQKYHDDLKSGKMDSTQGVTVEKVGGTECQKCHY